MSKTTTHSNIKYLLYFTVITVFVLIAYYPIIANPNFLLGDDMPFIIDNIYIQHLSISNIVYVFSHSVEGYHPLSMLMFSFEWAIAPNNALFFHIVNIVLHVFNCFLLILLLRKIFDKNVVILFIVLLFAINPVQVQTVSQISEQRGLLMTLFYFISLIHYVNYLSTSKKSLYFYSILFFILSVLANGRAIPLVLVLFLWDYFKGEKIFTIKGVIAKLPFLFIALIFGIINIYAQKETGYSYKIEGFNHFDYLMIGGYSIIQYVINLMVPYNLSWGYPYPVITGNILPLDFYIFSIIAIGLTLYIVLNKKVSKEIKFGYLFYLFNIIFLVRLFSPLTENIMEDHYSYIPSAGVFIIIGYLFSYLKVKVKYFYIFITFVIIILVYGTITYQRNIIWQDSMTLYTDVLKKDPNRFVARNNRGYIYLKEQKYEYAIEDFKVAIQNKKEYADPYYGTARAYEELGYPDSSLKFYSGYINLSKIAFIDKSQLSAAFNNRGVILAHNHQYNDAMADFENAISSNPDNSDPYVGLAFANAILNNKNKAIKILNDAQIRFPNDSAIVNAIKLINE